MLPLIYSKVKIHIQMTQEKEQMGFLIKQLKIHCFSTVVLFVLRYYIGFSFFFLYLEVKIEH